MTNLSPDRSISWQIHGMTNSLNDTHLKFLTRVGGFRCGFLDEWEAVVVARIPFKKSRKPLTFAPLIIYNPTFSSRLLSFPPSSFLRPLLLPPDSHLFPPLPRLLSSFPPPTYLLPLTSHLLPSYLCPSSFPSSTFPLSSTSYLYSPSSFLSFIFFPPFLRRAHLPPSSFSLPHSSFIPSLTSFPSLLHHPSFPSCFSSFLFNIQLNPAPTDPFQTEFRL